jgi:hypothetical protein
MPPVNEEAIRSWAIRRGFSPADSGMLSIPYADGEVALRIDGGRIEVLHVQSGKSSKVFDNVVKNLHLDQFDMLHGAGLFSRYNVIFREDGLRPPWFSEAFLVALEG